MEKQRADEIIAALKNELTYIKMIFPFYDGEVTCGWDGAGASIPFTKGNTADITINVKERKVVDWDTKYSYWKVFAKPKDEGVYDFLDKDFKLICRQDGYVPNEFVPPKEGFGDYIEISVDTDGNVDGWYEPTDVNKFVCDNTMIVLPEELLPTTENAAEKSEKIATETLVPLAKEIFEAVLAQFDSKYDYIERNIFVENKREEREYFDATSKKDFTLSYSRPYDKKNLELTSILGISIKFIHYQCSYNDKQWHFQEDFEILFRKDSYYIPLVDAEYDYTAAPTQSQLELIYQTMTNKIVAKYKEGKQKNSPQRRWII